jgi:hypothetical protein
LEDAELLRVVRSDLGQSLGSKLSDFVEGKVKRVEFTVAEVKAMKKIVVGAAASINTVKEGTFTSLTPGDIDVLKKLTAFYNRGGGTAVKSLFFTVDSPIDHMRSQLLDLGVDAESLKGALREGISEEQTMTHKLQPLSYVLEQPPLAAHSGRSISYTSKTDLLATRLLNSVYQTQLRVKTLGIPEMDTVNEIYKRSIFFVVRDVSRERYLDMNLNSKSTTSSRADRIHWLSGQYRPIGIVHTISPSEGYTTELKLYRDIRAVEGLTDNLQSAIEEAGLL